MVRTQGEKRVIGTLLLTVAALGFGALLASAGVFDPPPDDSLDPVSEAGASSSRGEASDEDNGEVDDDFDKFNWEKYGSCLEMVDALGGIGDLTDVDRGWTEPDWDWGAWVYKGSSREFDYPGFGHYDTPSTDANDPDGAQHDVEGRLVSFSCKPVHQDGKDGS